MHHVHSGLAHQHFGEDVRRASAAEGSDVQFPRIRLAPCDEFLEVGRRDGDMQQQQLRAARTERQWGEVAEWVVRNIGERMRVLHERAVGRIENGVAVGRRARDLLRGDHGARARLVLHQHRHAQRLGEPGRHDARLDVRGAAGGEADQHADRLPRFGKGLRPRGQREPERANGDCKSFHAFSSCLIESILIGRRSSALQATSNPRPMRGPQNEWMLRGEARPPRRLRVAYNGPGSRRSDAVGAETAGPGVSKEEK